MTINVIVRPDDEHHFFVQGGNVTLLNWHDGAFHKDKKISLDLWTNSQLPDDFKDGIDTILRVNERVHYFIKKDQVVQLDWFDNGFHKTNTMTLTQWTSGQLNL